MIRRLFLKSIAGIPLIENIWSPMLESAVERPMMPRETMHDKLMKQKEPIDWSTQPDLSDSLDMPNILELLTAHKSKSGVVMFWDGSGYLHNYEFNAPDKHIIGWQHAGDAILAIHASLKGSVPNPNLLHTILERDSSGRRLWVQNDCCCCWHFRYTDFHTNLEIPKKTRLEDIKLRVLARKSTARPLNS